MTQNKIALLIMKETIDGFDGEDKDKIVAYAEIFRKLVTDAKELDEGNEALAAIAISLVGLETAVSLEA